MCPSAHWYVTRSSTWLAGASCRIFFASSLFSCHCRWYPHPLQMSGVYDLSVRLWTDWRVFTHIYGSPFRLAVSPAGTSADETDVAGAGLLSGVAGSAFAFVITARDSLGNLRGTGGDDWQVRSSPPRSMSNENSIRVEWYFLLLHSTR